MSSLIAARSSSAAAAPPSSSSSFTTPELSLSSGWATDRRIVFPALAAVALLVVWEAIKTRPVLAMPAVVSAASFAALAISAIGALYVFIARCLGKRAAMYGVLVLATTPAWFVRARVDGASLAFPVIAFACIGLAVLDARLDRRARLAAAIAAGVVAWIGARTMSTGLLISLGAPALAMGGSYFLGRSQSRFDSLIAAAVTLIGGVVVLSSVIAVALLTPHSAFVNALLGPKVVGAAASSTTGVGFAATVPRMAYALAPWTPLVPFALVRGRQQRLASARTRVALVLVVVLTLAAEIATSSSSSMSRQGAGASATFACGAIATCVGALLEELDDLERPGSVLAMGVFALGALIAHDVMASPDRVLDVLAGGLPTGHALAAAQATRVVLWIIAGVSTLALIADAKWLRLGRSFRSFRVGRGLLIALAGLACGFVLRMHTYPDLVARISPGRAFDAWSDKRKDGDVLGLLGVDEKRWPRALASAANDDDQKIVKLDTADNAVRWLVEPAPAPNGDNRRFLAIGPSELARLNAAFRAKSGRNVPIVTGEGAFLLGVNALRNDERSENPLDAIVMSTPPERLHVVDAQLEALDVLGWEIVDAKGKRQEALPARKSAHLRIAARVRALQQQQQQSSLRGYCTFIHIDHTPTRFGAEHREHTYAMALWREGDVVIDDFAVDLPPHFGAGSYAAYWGVGVLPCQDDHRMHIISGATDGHDRVVLGRIEVR